MNKKNSKLLKVAVIGTGKMGKNHVRIFSQIPNVKIVALADTNEAIGKEIAKKYNTKLYLDYEEMLEKEELDIVSVCVPTYLHFQVGLHCLKKGINTLLEKPIASTEKEAKELLRIAAKKKVNFLVGHIERFNPGVRKVKEIIKKGELGKIIAITSRRIGGFPAQITDSNIVVDLAIHDIDISNFLLDDLPKESFINKRKYLIQSREDAVEIFLKYRNASSYIQANWISPIKIRKLTITGTKGYLELDYITQRIDFYVSNFSKFKEVTKGYSDYILLFSEPERLTINVSKKEPLREEIIYFVNALRNNDGVNSSFAADALKIALS